MSFEDRLGQTARAVEASLDVLLQRFSLKNLPGVGDLADAMRYAVLGGGKRMRAFLVLETAALHDIPEKHALYAAAAIEVMHAYSLVHDDLPCMDDDDMRRGQPTVHRKWDEATAVLVGDALQSFAFELISMGKLAADRKLVLSQSLAIAAGGGGMVMGQVMDIAAEEARAPFSLETITGLQLKKTGALIEWSVLAGPRMAGVAREGLEPFRNYAQALGLAFQIADDILDVTGDEGKAGKRLKKDAEAGKATFVTHLGLEGAREKARELVAEALHNLTPYGAEADALRDAARFAISREF